MLRPEADAAEPTACFELMMAGFERAQQRTGPALELDVGFGPRTVRLRFAGESLADALTPALAHLRVPTTPTVDLTVHLWDSRSSGAMLSPLIEVLRQHVTWHPFDRLTPRHEIIGVSNDRVPATLDHWSGALSVYDRATASAVYWVDDACGVPYFERAAPLRTLLSWWLSDVGFQSMHAAAVGSAEGGVLLAGRGGSGKSTTALRCLEAGLGYVADDYCVVSVGPPPQAFSMYNTAKVNGSADLEQLPRFRPMVENPDAAGDEKLMMFLARHVPELLVRSFPIEAILVPVVGDGPTSLDAISPATALRALGPTTLLQRPGSDGAALRAMGALVRSVPSYELRLGSHPREVPIVIANLLGR